MIKTYGAKGLMEWQCQIHSGKTTLHVPFTGGTQTEYGVTPAKYSTSNPVIQAMIERSDYFRRGRITVVNAPKGKAAAVRTDDTPAPKLEEKGFATLADAKQWLADTYGVPQPSIRVIADAVQAAAKNGVKLTVGTKR